MFCSIFSGTTLESINWIKFLYNVFLRFIEVEGLFKGKSKDFAGK